MRVVKNCKGEPLSPPRRLTMADLDPGEVGIGTSSGEPYLRIRGDAVRVRDGEIHHLSAVITHASKATLVTEGCKCNQ